MGKREKLFAALLLVASGLVVTGVAGWSQPAALIVAGLLLAVWAWLTFAEVPGPAQPDAWVPSVLADEDDDG